MLKRVVSCLLCLLLCLPIFALSVLSAGTAAAYAEGLSLDRDELYYITGGLDSAPNTYQIAFKIHSDPRLSTLKAGDTVGVLLSNYCGFDIYPYFHFEIRLGRDADGSSYLYPHFRWQEQYGNDEFSCVFSGDDPALRFQPDEWIDLSFVIDVEQNYGHFYKNGALALSIPARILLADMEDRNALMTVCVGNSHEKGQPYPLGGSLRTVTLYDTARSAAQIEADYRSGVSRSTSSLLGHWRFSSSDKGQDIANIRTKGPSLSYSKIWLTESEMDVLRAEAGATAYDYTFAVVGDIQYAVEYDALHGTNYAAQTYRWLADHQAEKNIRYAIGVGDLTNNDIASEWEVAYTATSQLNGILDYSVVRGNHDVFTGGQGFNQRYASDEVYMSQFSGSTGGVMSYGSAQNTWRELTFGSDRFLLLNLDWNPSEIVFAWANDVIESHPDHRVIIVTHAYLHVDGTTIDLTDSTYPAVGYGYDLWNELASLHENVELVISGHQEYNNIAMRQSLGVHGNTVTQFLIDAQDVDGYFLEQDQPPVGIVALFHWNEQSDTVWIEYVSTIRDTAGIDAYYYQTVNQFSVDLKAECDPQDTGWNGYAVEPAGLGTEQSPYLISHPGNLLWMSQEAESAGTEETTPLFENVYFKQTRDLDLNRCSIKSIGSVISVSQVPINAFGGHYDGGGYTIRNGRIVSQFPQHDYVRCYGDALFGAVVGGTIQNLTLDQITVYSRGISGTLVGIAIPYAPDGQTPRPSLISNCHVTRSCVIRPILPYGIATLPIPDYDSAAHAAVVGSVCGAVFGSTVTGCSSAAILEVDGVHATVGGIAGIAGNGTVIDRSFFTGSLVLADPDLALPAAFGGIVGLLSPTGGFADSTLSAGLMITNCYNNGSFIYDGGATPQSDVHWGGILGYAPKLPAPSTQLSEPYIIENCYNSFVFSELFSSARFFIGGLVGMASATDDSRSLLLRNCYSVALYATGGEGTNEYRHDGTANKSQTPPIVVATDLFGKETVATVTYNQLFCGEVAYLLGDAFGQKLGTDFAPVLGGPRVYPSELNPLGYANNNVFTGASVDIGANLSLNFFVKHDCNCEGDTCYVVFTVGDEEFRVDDCRVADGELVFTLSGLDFLQMDDNICAAFYAHDELINTKTDYSIKQYIQQVLVQYTHQEETVSLMSEFVRYCEAWRTVLTDTESASLSDGMVGLSKPSTDLPTSDTSTWSVYSVPDGPVSILSLDFHGTDWQIQLSAPEDMALSMEIGGTVFANPTTNGAYFSLSAPLLPMRYDPVYTLEIYGDGVLQWSLSCSFEGMYRLLQSGASPDAAELALAYYRYGQAALLYGAANS